MSSLWPCGFWGLIQDTHKNFRAMRQHQKYKDFGVIAAHTNSWSRLETGFDRDKPLHARTSALFPWVCSKISQDKRSAAITGANENADLKKKTCFLSKTPTLIGTAWSLFYNLFPPGKAEIDPYLVYFWSTISVLVLIKNSICLTLLRFWFVELISFHLFFFYKYLCTYLTKNLFLNIYFSKCQHLLYESAVFCSIPSPAKASSVHPWDPPQFHCTYIFG